MNLRLFIALNLPQDARNALAYTQECLSRLNPHIRVKWVNPALIHLTLHFLGDVPEERGSRIKTILSEGVKEAGESVLGLGQLGGFPNPERPRVIWVGLTGKVRELVRLHSQLRKLLINAGFEADLRPFNPHLTLGRIKVPQVFRGLDSSVESCQFKVDRVDLMKSKLLPAGPQYITLTSVMLK